MVILIKWIKGFLKKPFIIIKGNFYRIINSNKFLYLSRYYGHCSKCIYNTDTRIGEVCDICGCPLQSKLRLKEEKCEINKW